MKTRAEIERDVLSCIETSGIRWQDGFELASLDVIVLAVRIEKMFGFQFGLDEIDEKSFSSLDKIVDLISVHTAKP